MESSKSNDESVSTRSAVAVASSLPPSVKKVGAIGTGAISFDITINGQSQVSLLGTSCVNVW